MPLERSTARIWNTETAQKLVRIAGHVGAVINGAFRPDGDWLATGATDDTTRVWDITPSGSREWLTLTDHPFVVDVAFSPDGTWLATSGFDDTGRI